MCQGTDCTSMIIRIHVREFTFVIGCNQVYSLFSCIVYCISKYDKLQKIQTHFEFGVNFRVLLRNIQLKTNCHIHRICLVVV